MHCLHKAIVQSKQIMP